MYDVCYPNELPVLVIVKENMFSPDLLWLQMFLGQTEARVPLGLKFRALLIVEVPGKMHTD